MQAEIDASNIELHFSLGTTAQQREWKKTHSAPWSDIANWLQRHEDGEKDGLCFVPGTFTGINRKTTDIKEITAAVWDIDAGYSLQEIESACRDAGIEAVVSSTFSHLSPRSKVKRSAFEKWRRDRSDNESASDVETYLIEVKKKRPSIAAGAEISGEEITHEKDKGGQLVDVVYLLIEHTPCPKFRVVAPLAEPWRPDGYDDIRTACADWAEALVNGGEELLGLVVDHSCSDPSRLFYTPRRPADGPKPETAFVAGEPIRFEELVARAKQAKARKSEGNGSAEFDFNTAGSQFSGSTEHIVFTDPGSKQESDLTRWAAKYGNRFKIIDALRARSGGVLKGISATSGEHIQCPRSDWHSSPSNEREAFAWNAGDGDGTGFGIFCQHDGCKIGTRGIDRLAHLEQMLTLGWLKVADLTADQFLRSERVVESAPAEPLGDPFGKLAAPPLPSGLLPATIEAYAEHEARAKGVVFHAPAMAALTVCAAAIPDGVRIKVKVYEPWHERACLWLALIGPPSAKKSPVVRGVMAPLKRLEKQEHARWCQLKAEWDKANKESRGDAPVPRRYILNDTTIEAGGKLLAENPQGMLLERDELAGWFGAMDKYSSGKGAAADRAFWLQSWNGGSYTVDRVSRASNYISNLSVSILGGIQPDAIRRIADDTVDDGLLQRLIPITVGSAGVGEDSPDHGHSFREYDGLIARLAGLQPQVIKFDGDAQEIRRAFERHTHELSNLEVLSPQLAAFCGKLDGLFARLALTFHCCESQPPPEHVSEETARRVDRLMREFIIPHAMRFYLEIAGETGTMASARSIAGYILAKKVDRLTFGILSRDCWPCRKRSRADVIQMLEPLEMFGWLTPDDPIVPRAWTVRPEVHEKFAEQASQERERRESVRTTLQQAISAKEQ